MQEVLLFGSSSQDFPAFQPLDLGTDPRVSPKYCAQHTESLILSQIARAELKHSQACSSCPGELVLECLIAAGRAGQSSRNFIQFLSSRRGFKPVYPYFILSFCHCLYKTKTKDALFPRTNFPGWSWDGQALQPCTSKS